MTVLLGLAVLAAVAAGAPSATAAEASIWLHDAIAQGKVEVSITGRGVSTGDSIWVQVRRRVPEPVHVYVSPGTLLVSKSGNVQRMAAHRIRYEVVAQGQWKATPVISLRADGWRTCLLEAYCCDFNKPTPQAHDAFTVAVRAEPKARAILARSARLRATPRVVQAAIWMDLNGANEAALRRGFQISREEFTAAQALLQVEVEAGPSGAQMRIAAGGGAAGNSGGGAAPAGEGAFNLAEVLAQGGRLLRGRPILPGAPAAETGEAPRLEEVLQQVFERAREARGGRDLVARTPPSLQNLRDTVSGALIELEQFTKIDGAADDASDGATDVAGAGAAEEASSAAEEAAPAPGQPRQF